MRQSKRKLGGFTLKSVNLTEKGVTYETFRLCGWLNGKRIRRQFRSRDVALGEKNRLEVAAANSDGSIHTVNAKRIATLTTATTEHLNIGRGQPRGFGPSGTKLKRDVFNVADYS